MVPIFCVRSHNADYQPIPHLQCAALETEEGPVRAAHFTLSAGKTPPLQVTQAGACWKPLPVVRAVSGDIDFLTAAAFTGFRPRTSESGSWAKAAELF